MKTIENTFESWKKEYRKAHAGSARLPIDWKDTAIAEMMKLAQTKRQWNKLISILIHKELLPPRHPILVTCEQAGEMSQK